ncbi:MAG: ATP-binding protein [Bacteroidales bacterium]|nr:ATP-binding protein [Bacteroidales bacterium]
MKRVFIELHNYSFHHGATEVGDTDERFVGRERLLERFKSVLINTTRKSGIYLVTGYRGMGKTSFVNKAIEEIYYPNRIFKSLIKCAVLLLLSCLLTIMLLAAFSLSVDADIFTGLRNISYSYIGIGILLTIIYGITYKKILPLWKRLRDIKIEETKSKHRQYFEEFILMLFLSSIVTLFISSLYKEKIGHSYEILNFVIWSRNIIYCYLCIIILLSMIKCINWMARKRRITKQEYGKKRNIIINYIINPLRRLINYSSTLTIAINLGYSNLKEINVLKLIVRNIKSSFEQYQKRISLSKLFRIFLAFLILIFVAVLYNSESLKRFNNSFKSAIALNVFFPSQNKCFLKSDSLLLNKINISLHERNKLSSDNYFIYVQAIANELNKLDSKNYNAKKIVKSKTDSIFNANQIVILNRTIDYLKSYDKNILKYLNIAELEKLDYDSFKAEFVRKQLNFFRFTKLYNSPAGIRHDKVVDILDKSAFIDLEPDEIIDLIKYCEENDLITLVEDSITPLFLYRLKRLHEIISFYEDKSGVQRKVIATTNYIDFYLNEGYYYLRKLLPDLGLKIIPLQLDYLYYLYVLFFIIFFRFTQRLLNYSHPSLRKVRKKLRFINELIDSNLAFEEASNINFLKMPVAFMKRKSQLYTKADEREIEKYILEIIHDISNLPINSYRSDFIFIFDELDKIEPIIKKDESKNKNAFYSSENIRNRQQTVMLLLSNLKYFLSTAHAKFVFIAGREMFDASLADVSDRNFRIGSIFHDIFYLNSFYSDLSTKKHEDITSRTEQYVCQFLMPEEEQKPMATLKEFNKYLEDKIYTKKTLTANKNQEILLKQEREKIIYLLQQFIVFLNHQSAGAPSKINSFFENYVVSKAVFNDNLENYSIVVGNPDSENLFLFFDYYNQYELGLINYLITPFNYSINKAIKNYGDKLIVSASFLYNHLFKFHRKAFSWRDLEATPEMVDINKNPELRDFLSRLIDFMLKTHIQEIYHGIYDFKFPKKISQEMLYLSHVSEVASASFNFTLDESLNVKQHYLEQMARVRDVQDPENRNKYEYSIASINLTLGDLCYYDGDIGDSIIYYLEAIQKIRNLNHKVLPITQLVLLTRNMLKLGNALEIRKTFDSAHLTYNEIIDKILNKIVDTDNNNVDFVKAVLNNINYLYQPLLAKLHLIEKSSPDGIKESDLKRVYRDYDILSQKFDKWDNFESKEAREIYNNEKYFMRVILWNRVGDILYYKNQVVESVVNCPFKKTDNDGCPGILCSACKKYYDSLKMVLSNFKIDLDTTGFNDAIIDFLKTHKDKVVRNIEYNFIALLLSNVADIFLSCIKKDAVINNDYIENIINYLDGKANVKLENILPSEPTMMDLMIFYFLYSAHFFKVSNDHKRSSSQYTNILNFMNEYTANSEKVKKPNPEDPILNVNRFIMFVDKIASRAIKDVYTSYDHIHNYEISRLKKILDPDEKHYIHNKIALNRGSINTDLDEINIVTEKIKLNFKDSIDMKSMECFNLYNLISPHCINSSMFNRILKLQLREKMNIVILNGNLSIPEITTFDYTNYVKIITSMISNINKKKLFFGEQVDVLDLLDFIISDSIFGYYEIIKICNTFDRSFSLNHSLLAESHHKLWIWSEYYKVYLVFYACVDKCIEGEKGNEILKYIGEIYKEEPAERGFEVGLKELIEKTTIDNFRKVKQKQKFKNLNIVELVENLIEPDNLQFVSPLYQCEKAINAYYAAFYTHNQGQAYKKLIENMHFLNDDFNDELYHFSVALERYKINTGLVASNITKLKNRTKSSDLYKHNNYIKEIVK